MLYSVAPNWKKMYLKFNKYRYYIVRKINKPMKASLASSFWIFPSICATISLMFASIPAVSKSRKERLPSVSSCFVTSSLNRNSRSTKEVVNCVLSRQMFWHKTRLIQNWYYFQRCAIICLYIQILVCFLLTLHGKYTSKYFFRHSKLAWLQAW